MPKKPGNYDGNIVTLVVYNKNKMVDNLDINCKFCLVMEMFKLEQSHSACVVDIATALATSVSSMLGSPYNNKWIITEDETILSYDILVFLKNIDLEHPMSQLIRTCCEEYQNSFGCGTKTLLFFIGQWTNLCNNLKLQGFPPLKIFFFLKENLKDLIEFLDQLVIPTNKFHPCNERIKGREREKFNSRSLIIISEDSKGNDALTRNVKSSQNEDLDLEDEDINWFLGEAEQNNVSGMATQDHKVSDITIYDNEKSFCQSLIYCNNNALDTTAIDYSKSSSSSERDEDFDHCFDSLESNDANSNEKSFQISLNKSKISNSLLSSTKSSGKTFKAEQFLEFLDSRCQQFQNQALRNSIWSSRHLSSLDSEFSVDSKHCESTDILKFCHCSISSIETKNENIKTASYNTINKSQIIDYSIENSSKLDFDGRTTKNAKPEKEIDYQTKNIYVTPELNQKVNKEKKRNQFCNFDSLGVLQQSKSTTSNKFCNCDNLCTEISPKCSTSLVYGLCHGSSESIADFLIKAVKHQNRNNVAENKPLRLHTNMLHLCCIQGPSVDSSCFIPGVVLSAKIEKLYFWNLIKMQNLPLNILLVKASITPQSRHIGYKKLANVENTCSKDEFINSAKVSTRHRWISRIHWNLKQLKVNVVVSTGQIDEDLDEALGSNGIMVFENTEQSGIEAMANLNENSRIEPVVYITDATKKNIITGLSMELFNADQIPSSKKDPKKIYVVFSSTQSQVQTLVLHHPAKSGLDLLSQEFWLDSHRVSSALKHGNILPGRGITEEKCAEYLLNKAGLLQSQFFLKSNEHKLYEIELLLKLAESFQSFAKYVSLNSGKSDFDADHRLILDDHFTKIQAWKTAMQLVCIISRIDAQIVLGMTQ